MIINFIRGFLMALADSVPGVSGGTIAFLLGFYNEFIISLNDLMGKDNEKRKQAFKFMIKIGGGWIVGMILAILILTSLFEEYIYAISSLFIGFIIMALFIIVQDDIKELLKNKRYILLSILGIVIVVLIATLKPNTNVSTLTDLNFLTGLYIFICGAIAISAMILPGISGSTLLLIFGLYIPIINGIESVLKLNFESLPALIIFGCGIIFGIFSVIKIIKFCITKYKIPTLYFIVGLMIGSIYAIILGPTTLEVAKDALSFATFNIFTFLIGCILIFGLNKLSKMGVKKSEK